MERFSRNILYGKHCCNINILAYTVSAGSMDSCSTYADMLHSYIYKGMQLECVQCYV